MDGIYGPFQPNPVWACLWFLWKWEVSKPQTMDLIKERLVQTKGHLQSQAGLRGSLPSPGWRAAALPGAGRMLGWLGWSCFTVFWFAEKYFVVRNSRWTWMFWGVEGTSEGRKLVIILAGQSQRGQALDDAQGKNSPSSKWNGMWQPSSSEGKSSRGPGHVCARVLLQSKAGALLICGTNGKCLGDRKPGRRNWCKLLV